MNNMNFEDALKRLEEIGILEGEKQGREMIFKHPALMKILQE